MIGYVLGSLNDSPILVECEEVGSGVVTFQQHPSAIFPSFSFHRHVFISIFSFLEKVFIPGFSVNSRFSFFC